MKFHKLNSMLINLFALIKTSPLNPLSLSAIFPSTNVLILKHFAPEGAALSYPKDFQPSSSSWESVFVFCNWWNLSLYRTFKNTNKIQIKYIWWQHYVILEIFYQGSSNLSSPTWLGIQTLLILDSRFRGNDKKCFCIK